MPGWDEWIIEATRKLAHHGFATIAPHLYFREGPGSPDDVGARVRAAGGVPDEQVVGDAKGAAAYLRAQPQRQRQGRRDRLLLRRPPRLSDRLPRAGVRRAGRLLGRQRDRRRSQGAQRQAPGRADRSRRQTSSCPILGLFGNDDENPNADQVNRTEAVLKKLGKNYEFHRYDGAGHAFFNTSRVAYRAEQAADGWKKVFAFFNKHLAG